MNLLIIVNYSQIIAKSISLLYISITFIYTFCIAINFSIYKNCEICENTLIFCFDKENGGLLIPLLSLYLKIIKSKYLIIVTQYFLHIFNTYFINIFFDLKKTKLQHVVYVYCRRFILIICILNKMVSFYIIRDIF